MIFVAALRRQWAPLTRHQAILAAGKGAFIVAGLASTKFGWRPILNRRQTEFARNQKQFSGPAVAGVDAPITESGHVCVVIPGAFTGYPSVFSSNAEPGTYGKSRGDRPHVKLADAVAALGDRFPTQAYRKDTIHMPFHRLWISCARVPRHGWHLRKRVVCRRFQTCPRSTLQATSMSSSDLQRGSFIGRRKADGRSFGRGGPQGVLAPARRLVHVPNRAVGCNQGSNRQAEPTEHVRSTRMVSQISGYCTTPICN
jgi:hypothetical protein